MAKTKINSDEYGYYVRVGGFLFRPKFTIGNDPRNPDVEIKKGDVVNVHYKGHGKYARITKDNNVLYWENHGAYIIPDENGIRYVKSNLIYNQEASIDEQKHY